MAKKSGKRLGRGLSSLVTSTITRPPPTEMVTPPPKEAPAPPTQPTHTSQPAASAAGGPQVQMVALDSIRTNPNQPRREFDRARLEALAESLRRDGALQPIVLRHHHGGYELVAGERRYRASRLAGLREIPAMIRTVSDDKLLELALVENIQREDLNPVEKARAYQQLAQKYGMSHDEIAAAMGEDRSSVTNSIRLLGLAAPCLDLLSQQKLTAGHAKALLSVTDSATQIRLAECVIAEGWSVRKLEAEAAQAKLVTNKVVEEESAPKRAAVVDLQDRLTETLGSKVTIREGRKKHSGKIVIHYYNLEEFEHIAEHLGLQKEGI